MYFMKRLLLTKNLPCGFMIQLRKIKRLAISLDISAADVVDLGMVTADNFAIAADGQNPSFQQDSCWFASYCKKKKICIRSFI